LFKISKLVPRPAQLTLKRIYFSSIVGGGHMFYGICSMPDTAPLEKVQCRATGVIREWI